VTVLSKNLTHVSPLVIHIIWHYATLMLTILSCNIKMCFSIPTHCKSYPFSAGIHVQWWSTNLTTLCFSVFWGASKGFCKRKCIRITKWNTTKRHNHALKWQNTKVIHRDLMNMSNPNKSNTQSFNKHIQSYIICLTCFTFTTDWSYMMFNTKNKILTMEWNWNILHVTCQGTLAPWNDSHWKTM